jgi:type I restriction enzyme S subunit
MLQVDCNNSNFDLPLGWERVALGDISEINPRFENKSANEDIEVTFVPMRCVQEMSGTLDTSITKKLSEVKKGYTSFRDYDLLFAKITPCMENGKVAIARNLRNGIGFGSTEFHVIRLHPELPPEFLFYYLLYEGFRKEAKRSMTGTAGQLRVSTNFMRETCIPIPPISEQYRIIHKIERLFANLDSGAEGLKKVKANVLSFRQSILKYAFEGRLTTGWRSAQLRKIQDPSTLFNEAEQFRESDQKVHTTFDADLDELPSGWVWTRLGNVASVMDVDHKMPKSAPDGLLFISPKDFVQSEEIDFEHAKRISKEDFERLSRKCKPQFGDIVYSRIGARLGRARKVPKDIEFQISYSLCLVRPQSSLQRADFLYWLMKSPLVYKQARARIRSVGVPDLGLGEIRNFLVPLPPLEEQSVISELVERYFSFANRLGTITEHCMKEMDMLKQLILVTAFKGKLVSQESGDEAADLLLERIKRIQHKRYDEKPMRNTTLEQKDLTDYAE